MAADESGPKRRTRPGDLLASTIVQDEAKEIGETYLKEVYAVTEDDIIRCRAYPKRWVLIERRG